MHDCFKSYGNVKWNIPNGWILPSDEAPSVAAGKAKMLCPMNRANTPETGTCSGGYKVCIGETGGTVCHNFFKGKHEDGELTPSPTPNDHLPSYMFSLCLSLS